VSIPENGASAEFEQNCGDPDASELNNVQIAGQLRLNNKLEGRRRVIRIYGTYIRSAPRELTVGDYAKIHLLKYDLGAVGVWRWRGCAPAPKGFYEEHGEDAVCGRKQFGVKFRARATVTWTLHRIKRFYDKLNRSRGNQIIPSAVAWQDGSTVKDERVNWARSPVKVWVSSEKCPCEPLPAGVDLRNEDWRLLAGTFKKVQTEVAPGH